MLVTLWLAALVGAAAPAVVEVPAGVYTVDGRDEGHTYEVYLPAFSIPAQPTAGNAPAAGCTMPGFAQWAVASRNKAFTTAGWEQVARPTWTECKWTMDELDAEGVAGDPEVYVGGTPGPKEVDVPQRKVGRHHVLYVYPYQEEIMDLHIEVKAHRCMPAAAAAPSAALYVQGSGVNVRGGRGEKFPVLAIARAGQQVQELGKDGEFSFVQFEDEVVSTKCRRMMRGWVKTALLGAQKPDAEALLKEAQALVDAGNAKDAIEKLQRAAALRPGHLPTLELFQTVCKTACTAKEKKWVEGELKSARKSK